MKYAVTSTKILRVFGMFLVNLISLISGIIIEVADIISRRASEGYYDTQAELGPIMNDWFKQVYLYLNPVEAAFFQDGYSVLLKKAGRIDWSLNEFYSPINPDGTNITNH